MVQRAFCFHVGGCGSLWFLFCFVHDLRRDGGRETNIFCDINRVPVLCTGDIYVVSVEIGIRRAHVGWSVFTCQMEGFQGGRKGSKKQQKTATRAPSGQFPWDFCTACFLLSQETLMFQNRQWLTLSLTIIQALRKRGRCCPNVLSGKGLPPRSRGAGVDSPGPLDFF